MGEFIKSFSRVDYIFVLPIYSAGEKNHKKINNIKISNLLKKTFKKKKIFAPSNEEEMFKDLKNLLIKDNNLILYCISLINFK